MSSLRSVLRSLKKKKIVVIIRMDSNASRIRNLLVIDVKRK